MNTDELTEMVVKMWKVCRFCIWRDGNKCEWSHQLVAENESCAMFAAGGEE